MKLVALLGAALFSLTASRTLAEGAPEGSVELERHWYECDPANADDTTCDVRTKEPEDRAHPDAPIALTFGYGFHFPTGADRRLVGVVPPTQWIAALGIDLPGMRFPDLAIGAWVEYALEGYGSRELYGGSISTALTLHTGSIGVVLRYMLSQSEQPMFAALLRVSIGGAWGHLAWRDAARDTSRTSVDVTPIVLAGVGLTWRTPGLTLEAGVIEPFETLEFGGAGAAEVPDLSLVGGYIRLLLSIRVP